MRRIISAILALGILAVMGYSGARLWALEAEIRAEQSLKAEILLHKPDPAIVAENELQNPLAQLWEQNADIIGWITIPYTNINYPIVQASDNDYYLRRDLNGDHAQPGTIFMDYRCESNGAGYSIIYGHNMKSGAMFGTLNRFGEKSFFDSHLKGMILFEDGWHSLHFFAFLVVNANDNLIYSVPQAPGFLSKIASRALHYREIDVVSTDRIVALSTCSYAFQNARMVLVGKIV